MDWPISIVLQYGFIAQISDERLSEMLESEL